MGKIYLIRHGQPDYSPCTQRGYIGQGRDLGPLTEAGKAQAEATAHDRRLQHLKLIVSSPYTRALQTAAIISRVTGTPLTIEVDLHEWVPDITYQVRYDADADALCGDFNRCRGVYPAGETRRWETLESVRTRMRAVADKYADMEGIAFVSHCMALRTLIGGPRYLDYAEIAELDYKPDIPSPDFWKD